MNNNPQEQFKKLLLEKMDSFTKHERVLIKRVLERKTIVRNTNQEFDDQLTFGQHVADKVAAFGGSWTFILLFGGIILGWITLNTILLASTKNTFDPYPFILLNLVLSMLAALQAPVIMMSQNRLSVKDRLDASHDYEVNLKAEMEIANLHEKLDELREKKWAELVEMQQEQIRLLTQLLQAKNGA
jgi:uncharacterized membrane protein